MALKVALVGSPDKDCVSSTMERARRWLDGRAEVVFAEMTRESWRAAEAQPDLLFVLGGDGTLIATVHHLRDRQIPIVGINLGKLGFLAEFTIDQLEREGEFLFNGGAPVHRRVMLSVRLSQAGGERFESPAVNDCVVLAGAPFRMIELTVEADRGHVAEIRGDGLIVATAAGSTAHNLSAGGPILDPSAQSFVITPICPHSLTFRPLVLNADRRIVVRAANTNEGTTVSIDGQQRRPFRPGDKLTLTRYKSDFLLVRNPKRSDWYALRRKLMWGKNPKNDA